jgi:hypothetical protein
MAACTHSGPVQPDVRALAIGWLDTSHPYTAGSVDDAFVADLFAACRMHATARTRGWHQCTLCQAETKQRSIAAGESAEASVFWASSGDEATIMLGRDDETWDVALTVPTEVVERIAWATEKEA